jgi:hypothetical protein
MVTNINFTLQIERSRQEEVGADSSIEGTRQWPTNGHFDAVFARAVWEKKKIAPKFVANAFALWRPDTYI